MFQCCFAPVIFLDGTAVSCLLLVKHYDQRYRLPYQNPSGHPAVLSSCSLLATSRLFLSSRTTWASPKFWWLCGIEVPYNRPCINCVLLLVNSPGSFPLKVNPCVCVYVLVSVFVSLYCICTSSSLSVFDFPWLHDFEFCPASITVCGFFFGSPLVANFTSLGFCESEKRRINL